MSQRMIVLTLLLTLLLAACARETGGARMGGIEISRQDFDVRWPFRVEKGELRCEQKDGDPEPALTFRAGEASYALNAAASDRPDVRAVEEILAPGGQAPTNLAAVISRGHELCDIMMDQARQKRR